MFINILFCYLLFSNMCILASETGFAHSDEIAPMWSIKAAEVLMESIRVQRKWYSSIQTSGLGSGWKEWRGLSPTWDRDINSTWINYGFGNPRSLWFLHGRITTSKVTCRIGWCICLPRQWFHYHGCGPNTKAVVPMPRMWSQCQGCGSNAKDLVQMIWYGCSGPGLHCQMGVTPYAPAVSVTLV